MRYMLIIIDIMIFINTADNTENINTVLTFSFGNLHMQSVKV